MRVGLPSILLKTVVTVIPSAKDVLILHQIWTDGEGSLHQHNSRGVRVCASWRCEEREVGRDETHPVG